MLRGKFGEHGGGGHPKSSGDKRSGDTIRIRLRAVTLLDLDPTCPVIGAMTPGREPHIEAVEKSLEKYT